MLQIVVMLVLSARTTEMEDEMAMELRFSDKKYVHSYAWIFEQDLFTVIYSLEQLYCKLQASFVFVKRSP